MKRILNKSISLMIITILMIIHMCPVISMAKTDYKTYVALGDSIAYGYGLENKDTESYAQKVRGKCNISTDNFNNLAVSGMTCAEFYQKIQEDEYTNAIKKAELLTVSIGSNELLGLVTKTVAEVTGVTQGDPDFVSKVQSTFLAASMTEKVQMLTSIYNKFTSEEMKVEIERAIASYETNWKNSVEYIKQINPDIQIIATEFYNPYYEIALASYDLGGYVDEQIKKLNNILTTQSNSEKEYKIAKIYEAFNTTNPRITNVNISISNLNVDPHPNAAGHEVIYSKIVDVLESIEDTEKKDIATLTISDISDQEYTGQAITPEIIIKDGNNTLVKDTDYTVSYSENINVGEATVKILGIGNYTGETTKTFNIVNKTVAKKEISEATIGQIENQTYTGIKITPDIEIKDGNTELVKDTDYELSYNNNINVGQAEITIRGIGNYTGEATKNFKIIPKNISLATIQDIENQTYTGQAIQPTVSVTDGSAKLVEGTDYTVSYKNNINVGEATITVEGIGNYTGTADKNFNIIENDGNNSKDIASLTFDNVEDKIYTGKLITPEIRIKDGDTVLIKDTDYTINYSENMNVGTAKITVKGIGNYTGSVEKNFNIVAKEIKNVTILDIEDQTYTGKEIQPSVVIQSDGITLQEGTDYTIKYTSNKSVGTATIEIVGIGNYTGTTTKTFNIVKEEDNNNNNSTGNNNTNQNNNNNTVRDDKLPTGNLPFTGMSKIIGTLFIIAVCVAIALFRWMQKNKDIKY